MPKSDGAIFRIEEKDGKRYRVMYFKNSRGGYTRSKFPKELPPKKPKAPKGKRGRPKKATRVTENKKLILENRRAIINNAKTIQRKQTTTEVAPHSHGKNHPHIHKPVTPTSRFKRPGSTKYVKRAGNTQGLIDKWKNLAKK
jgi:hypothetical protein